MKILLATLRLSLTRSLARFTAKLALRSLQWMLARQMKPAPIRTGTANRRFSGVIFDGEARRIDRY